MPDNFGDLYRSSHCRLTLPLQLIRKYGRYHRPIARPNVFWLNRCCLNVERIAALGVALWFLREGLPS